jgi:hypothetical protein
VEGRDRIRLSQDGRYWRVSEHINGSVGLIKCGKFSRVAEELLAYQERPSA